MLDDGLYRQTPSDRRLRQAQIARRGERRSANGEVGNRRGLHAAVTEKLREGGRYGVYEGRKQDVRVWLEPRDLIAEPCERRIPNRRRRHSVNHLPQSRGTLRTDLSGQPNRRYHRHVRRQPKSMRCVGRFAELINGANCLRYRNDKRAPRSFSV